MNGVKGDLSQTLENKGWAMVNLDTKKAKLARLLTLSLPGLQLQTHIPDALALAIPPSSSISSASMNDFCKLPRELKSFCDGKPLPSYFLLGDVLYPGRYGFTSYSDKLRIATKL